MTANFLSEQLKEAQKYIQELEEKNALLNEIISLLPGHVYWKNTKFELQGCNNQQAYDAGLENPSRIVGLRAIDLIEKNQPEEERLKQADLIEQVDKEVLLEGKSINVEEIAVMKDGSMGYFISNKIPLHDREHNIAGLLGISLDITDRKNMESALKEAEEAAEKAKYMMTEFISNMGHDLATPITDVETVVMMLDEYADEYPELKDILQTLTERAAACEAVRKRILNATSLSHLEVKLETFSVVEVILELEKKFRSEIDEKKLKLLIHPLKPKKEDVITADREKFSAILEELLLNAIHFTDEGSISLSIIKENDITHIEVSDTGIGIPADKFDYIFEPYTKLAPSNQFGQTFKGPGCGLYLVEVRANILGASINVKSELGKGSTFTLSIPVHPKK